MKQNFQQEVKDYLSQLDEEQVINESIVSCRTANFLEKKIKDVVKSKQISIDITEESDNTTIEVVGTTQLQLSVDKIEIEKSVDDFNQPLEGGAESFFIDQISKLSDYNDILIWQGSRSGLKFSDSLPSFQRDSINLKSVNGFLHHLSNSKGVNYYNSNETLSEDNIMEVVNGLGTMATNLSITNPGLTLLMFMSFKNYRTYLKSLSKHSENYRNCISEVDFTFREPGTHLSIVPVGGLVGSDYILLAPQEILLIGAGDQFSIDIDTKECQSEDECHGECDIITYKYSLGTAVAYPQYCFVYDPNQKNK